MARKTKEIVFEPENATAEELLAEYDKQLRVALREKLQNIGAEVHDVIEKAVDEIICNALGVKRSSYGDRWEVDHCNGKRRALAEEMGAAALAQVKAEIPDFAKRLARDTPKAITKALREEYASAYDYRMRSAIRELAEADAQRDAAKAVAGLKKATTVTHDSSGT